MTTQIPAAPFTDPVPAQRLERAATALATHGFTVEILDDAAAARTRVNDLLPEGASVFTSASETLRLSFLKEWGRVNPSWPDCCDRFVLIPGSVRTNAGKGSGSRLDRRSTASAAWS